MIHLLLKGEDSIRLMETARLVTVRSSRLEINSDKSDYGRDNKKSKKTIHQTGGVTKKPSLAEGAGLDS